MFNLKQLTLSFFLVFFSGIGFTQDATSAAVYATVKSGESVVSGAVVTVENDSIGLTRSGTTNEAGQVRILSLPTGNYSITVAKAGYSNTESDLRLKVGINAYNVDLVTSGSNIEELVTTARVIKTNAYEINETGINIDVTELQTQIPVGRDLTSLTLLAPGSVEGDAAFGFLPSFGGSSVGENQYLVNGLNITNFRNFIGYSNVPFEFYDNVDVKTGGFQAQYGKAIGGFVTANTKSGSNDFEVKVNVSYAPDSLRDKQPDTYANANTKNTFDSKQYNVSVSGPIIKDKLFYYVLAAPTLNEASYFYKEAGSRDDVEVDETFWGAKIDYYFNDRNHLEITHFTDTADTLTDSYAWDVDTGKTGTYRGQGVAKSGGDNTIVSLSSLLSDNLTLDILWGKNEYERTTQAATDCCIPVIYDNRTSLGNSFAYRTAAVNFFTAEGGDEREQRNISLTWNVGNHNIKVGYEDEELTATQNQVLSGGAYILLAERTYPGCSAVPVGSYCVRVRDYKVGGEFGLENSAFYIQDSWNVTDRLNLNLGLRSSDYKNLDANGEVFIEVQDQVAHRIGATYDLFGDGKDKISVFFGNYYLPIAANTNIRLAGGEDFVHTYHALTNTVAGGNSILNASDIQYGPALNTVIVGDGTVPDTFAASTNNIEAMYQDEIIFGYTKFIDNWTLGAYVTYRDLASAIDDILVDHAVNAYCAANGIDGCSDVWYGPHSYVLANPGKDISWTTAELPGTTGPTTINLKAGDLAFPPVQREYTALDLTFDRAWDGQSFLGGSITISSNRGNYEGTVKSDNGQDDAGLTQDYDFPEFMDNAYGYLPNHRAFKMKLYGATYVGNTLVGVNFSTTSPRKYGCIGNYPGGDGPDDNFGGNYYYNGNDSWACNGVPTPRGQSFDGKWINNLDLSLSRDLDIPFFSEARIQFNIFNLFDFESPEDYNEYGEADGVYPDPDWKQPTRYQPGRSVRLNFTAKL